MTIFIRRSAGHTDLSVTKKHNELPASAAEPALRTMIRDAAAHGYKPELPSLRWRITEHGLRMSWELPAGTR